MNVSSSENLVKGTETDYGALALIGMSSNDLNMRGWSSGSSTIPTTGAQSCADPLTGVFDSTCTMTGLTSAGSVVLNNGNTQYGGSYQTGWSVPAIGFVTLRGGMMELGLLGLALALMGVKPEVAARSCSPKLRLEVRGVLAVGLPRGADSQSPGNSRFR